MIYYNDNNPDVVDWLNMLIKRGLLPQGVVDGRSILDVEPSDLKGFTQCHFFAGIGGWAYALDLAEFPKDLPVWTGSPPCQPFSVAGKQQGQQDERHLAPKFIELVRASKPPLLFGEQVSSAAVLGPSTTEAQLPTPEEPSWTWVDSLSTNLEAAGYSFGSASLPAASIGSPCIRQRLFFGAVRLGSPHIKRLERLGGYVKNPYGWSWEVGHHTSTGIRKLDRSLHKQWEDPDWVLGIDNKWRPVQPGTQLVVDGVPERVAKLEGIGNAIVPQLGATFVNSFMEVMCNV